MRIGYVGLGAMGGALAGRLLGLHPLLVWDARPAAVAALEARGARAAISGADLARSCDVLLLCLPRSADVQDALFGATGMAESIAPGTLVIDQTSGVPHETRAMAERLAARGVTMIDAPVSGGVSGAVAGTIAIMASGPEAALARAQPVLTAISPNVYRCGAQVGQGQAMKMVNNLMSAGCRLATLEAVAMGRRMGLPLAAITAAINLGSGRNRTSKVMLPALVDGRASASNFAMSLMLKDFNQAIALAMEADVPTPIASVVRGLLQAGVNMRGERAQLEEILGVIETMAGACIVAPQAPEAVR